MTAHACVKDGETACQLQNAINIVSFKLKKDAE